MYVIGWLEQGINSYALTTGFDLSTASYLESFSTASQETNPVDMAFNSDGTKMFVAGDSGNDINEYTVGLTAVPSGYHAAHTTTSTDSTFWTDINSMTADEAAGDGAIYYAVSTDDRTTWKIAKSTDGERSIVRNSSGTWQFNSNGTYGSETWTNGTTNTELATLQEAMTGATTTVGYDLASASYESKSFSVTSQETDPRAIEFNSDGTKMFVVGQASDTVFQYSLSTAYDISTASYDSVSFSVSSQESSAQGLVFKPDGTKMYIIGEIADAVFQYSLSTAFDLSTASYDSVSFSVSSQDTGPKAVNFNDDGTIMYVVGNNDSVFQYTLTTAYDISTASYASKSFSVTSQDTFPCGIKFNSDGTTMFILGGSNSSVFQYTLSTGFDVSTASYASIEFSTASQEATPRGITFNSDGTKLYIVGNNNDTVYQYTTAGTSYPNQMNKTQLDAVPDANHFTLSNDLDLAIIFNFSSGSTAPSSDGVSINYDANTLNQGAVLGTDYNWDFPATDKVRLTSLGDYNLKVRII
jgi:6-phosphogluconolactonase (cycloisomerase 2 family)